MKSLQIGMSWFIERSGGLNRYYYDCFEYLPKIGIEFQGLVVGSPQVRNDTEEKINNFASANDSILKRCLGVRKSYSQLSSKTQYDLIVSHFALYTFPILNLIKNIPLVTHFHGPWALESNVEAQNSVVLWTKKYIEKAVYNRSTSFIVLSQTFCDILHQEYQVPLEQINIIPGGVDIDRFNINLSPAEARTILNWHQERPTIFCIRRLAKRMGLENLVTAMVAVRDRYPDIILYIAGKGALADTLQSQITQLGLRDHVQLLGYIPDEQLPLCYRGANFSVVPTVALEGFGLVVVESLAAGTPVLGTPIGGIPEILRPFSEDLVLEGVAPKQLASGIIEVLSNDRILPTSKACLDYVQKNYNWQEISQRIKLVYQKASQLR